LTKILSERKNIIIDLQDLTFVRKVGEGAFSEVWEGYWNGVHVAIKKLKSMVDDELFQARFLREVESLRKGNHQNVVMFFGVCLRPACIITEFMAGGNLYDLLHKTGMKMSTALVVKLALDLAVGLLHLHSLTILHRDLTSLNILLDEMGNIKISDFGLSREKTQEGSMTMTLGGICNPRWRPPEITKNIGHYSEKVDVYSFALVVWEILTGELPFSNLDGPQAAAQVAYTGLRPVIPPTCPAPLRNLLQRCWADDAKLRPDFKEIVESLRAIQFNNPMGLASEFR
jgi:serine/threonine protein kinase